MIEIAQVVCKSSADKIFEGTVVEMESFFPWIVTAGAHRPFVLLSHCADMLWILLLLFPVTGQSQPL